MAADMQAVTIRRPQPWSAMPDFCSADFPEDAFPPLPAERTSYRRHCDRGRAAMGQMRVVITGLARNLGHVLPTTIGRIERLGSQFADHRVLIYENDSTDSTKLLLRHWAGVNRRVTVTMEDCHDPENPPTRCLARAERMARYRQRCQELVLERFGNFDAVIIADLDVSGGWSLDGVANSFGHSDWDFIGSNGLIYRREGFRINASRQYDMWALRFDEKLSPIPTARARDYVYSRGEPLVPVTSCFGGMGIYRMEAYRQGRYGAADTEHAIFHREMIRQGHGRLFLNPSQILVYGRRRRFADGLVERTLQAWNALRGRPAEPWLFGREPAGLSPTRRAAAA